MLDNFVGMVLLSWMPAFLYEKFHLSLAMSGLTATIFIQLASMVGSPVGGWLADVLRRRFPGGRIAVQMIGLIGAAPFVVWCGQTLSVSSLMMALTCWGLFKGLYDANIFASVLDVIRPGGSGHGRRIHEHDRVAGWRGHGSYCDRVHRTEGEFELCNIDRIRRADRRVRCCY